MRYIANILAPTYCGIRTRFGKVMTQGISSVSIEVFNEWNAIRIKRKKEKEQSNIDAKFRKASDALELTSQQKAMMSKIGASPIDIPFGLICNHFPTTPKWATKKDLDDLVKNGYLRVQRGKYSVVNKQRWQ